MTTETAAQPRDRRIVRRKPLKSGVTFTARKGAMGLGGGQDAPGLLDRTPMHRDS